MGRTTNIEWTDATWNPVRGCSRVSEGCRNCYAERQAARFKDVGQPFHQFVKRHVNGEPRWTGKVELVEKHLDDPLHWKIPRRIFVNSMSDLFHEALPDEVIDRVFAVVTLCPQHAFQVLTKRPERMLSYCSSNATLGRLVSLVAKSIGIEGVTVNWTWKDDGFTGVHFPNVWLGVSVEDQKTADERIPLLLQTPAAVRFVSYEPALGPVDWRQIPHLDWVIVGGESGPGARPFDIAWARNTIAQ